MSNQAIQSLSFETALAVYEGLRAPLRPATLHPGYVAADARRDPLLAPTYLRYQSQGECWLHSLHLTVVPGTRWMDASSPYGYGGPLSSTRDPHFLTEAWAAYEQWMRAQNVVVEYLRFHPALGNERHYGGTLADNRQVVSMELNTDDMLISYAPRLRYTVRKAERAGLVCDEGPLATNAVAYAAFYREAMQAMGTDRFYWFDDAYFKALAATGLARLTVCRSGSGGDWLAAALFLEGAGVTEYHLAASSPQGRVAGASSLVLHKTAHKARARGQKTLYLGGGNDTQPANPLLFFKGAFSDVRLQYRTGSFVFDAIAYDQLRQSFPALYAAHPERPIFYRSV